MSLGDVPTSAAPRARTLGPVLVIVLGYLILVLAMRFAADAPDAAADGPPTCAGDVMAVADVCEETRRELVARTGRTWWYADVDETLTYDEVAEEQRLEATRGEWQRGMLTGSLGLVVAFVGMRWLVTGRLLRRATTLVTLTLLPLLAATAFVGWAESKFEPDERPGVLLSPLLGNPPAALVMLGVVAMGTWTTVVGAEYRTSDPNAVVSGPSFGEFPLARWWERALARLIDTVVVAVLLLIAIAVAGIFIALVGAVLSYDPFAGALTVVVPALAVLVVIVYDTAYRLGKRMMQLRVVSRAEPLRGAQPASNRMMFIRAVTWWAPIFAVVVLLGRVSYVYMLLLLPVLNGLWPLWDRRARQSLNDRAAGTVVVRVRES